MRDLVKILAFRVKDLAKLALCHPLLPLPDIGKVAIVLGHHIHLASVPNWFSRLKAEM